MNPWPGAYTTARGKSLKVHATRVVEGTRPDAAAGTVILADKSRVLAACGEGTVELVSVQPEGKRAMKGSEWAMGRGVAEGDVLGSG
jgi:methionyl-tRNA formyltransferase